MVRNKYFFLNILITTLFLLLCRSCCFFSQQCGTTEQQESLSYFQMRCDTVYIDRNEWHEGTDFSLLNSLCRYNGNYILDFDKELAMLSGNLKSLNPFPNPEFFERDEELFVRNDSLMITSFDKDHNRFQYYNPKRKQWEYFILKRDESHKFFDEIYEDDEYKVFHIVQSEGMGYLIFERKSIGNKKIFFSSSFSRLFEHKSVYCQLGFRSITFIDPQNGVDYDSALHYELFERKPYNIDNVKVLAQRKHPNQDIIQMKEWSLNDGDTTLCSSWVYNDSIFVLANASKETFIAKLQGDSLQRVFNFDFKLEIQNLARYGFGRSDSKSYILLPFCLAKNNGKYQSGIIEIDGYDIHLIFLD